MASLFLCAPDLLAIKELEEQTFALRNSVICAFNHLFDLKDLNTGVHSTRLVWNSKQKEVPNVWRNGWEYSQLVEFGSYAGKLATGHGVN